jgi:ferredoxin-NADP reductase/fatty acid desaturase
MQHRAFSESNEYSSVWHKSVPDIAWGTILLFAAYLFTYYIVISCALGGTIPYGVASALCSYLAYVGFTVVHDAGHGSIVKNGSPLKPLETILGWITSIPLLVMPYPLFKRIHDRHHAFTNDPDRDPDHFKFGNKWYQVVLNCLYIPVQYLYLTITKLRNIKTIRDTFPTTIIYFGVVISTLTSLIYYGYFEELLYLVFIPNIISIFILTMFFDYIPHYPHKSVDRYHDSRIYPSKLLNCILLGQNYHLIHHMYPRLPWYKYMEVYERILPDLEANKSPIENISGGFRPGFMKSPYVKVLQDNGRSVNMLLKVDEIEHLNSTAVTVRFKLPKGEQLQYKAGQYVIISKWLRGEQQTRCYSLCSSPNKAELKIAVRQQESGLMSSYINNELAIGKELIVQGPFGDFIYPPTHDGEIDQLVLVAAGSGITPVLSILETALEESLKKQVHLIYACRSINSIMFFEHIESLKKAYPDSFRITYAIDKAELGVGRLDRELLISLLPDTLESNKTEFYICGPQGMKELVTTALLNCNVQAMRINVEAFVAATIEPIGKLHQIVISLADGQQHTLEVASNQTVLEVAKQKGVRLPHACGSGTCGTCKFKVLEGENPTIDDAIPGISAEDKAAGFTLVCQCMPFGDLSLSEVSP